jgi:SEC-C motif
MRTEQEIFNDLADLCVSPGYAHAIAFFCLRDNFINYQGELKGEDFYKLFSTDRLIRTEISTLIGLMVRKPVDLSVPSQQQLQAFIGRSEDLLNELHEVMSVPLTKGREARSTDQTADPFETAEAMREPIFYGPESGYTFQYRDLAVKKYARDEEWLRKNRGFSIEQGKQVVVAILNFLNDKLLATLREQKDAPEDAWNILGGFELSPLDIVAESGRSAEVVTNVLAAFAFANDGNPTFTSLQQFNATNAYPIIKVGEERYLLFQHRSLTEALYDTPFYWMADDRNYQQTASANRGKFAEKFAAERLERVFGSDKVFCNVDIWESKGKKLGEIDTLVLFSNRALVVQAKSKKLTLAAQRGNDLQLKGDFKSAVQDACDQAYACSEQITLGLARFTDAAGKDIQIPSSIGQIHPMCLVSDHYPALSFQARQFLIYKTTDTIKAPLVCDVFFLDVVTELLDSPLHCLSYLELRAAAGDNVFLSHEITALGYHLKQNLWLGEYNAIYLEDSISSDVDAAMTVRREGIGSKSTPPGILTQIRSLSVGRLIDEFNKRSDVATTGLGLELLKLSGNSARDLSRAIDKIVSQAANDGMEHDVTIALGQTSCGITVHCNTFLDLDAALKLRRHCELRKYGQRASKWFGVAVRPGSGALRFGLMVDYPWRADSQLEKAVEKMPKGLAPESLRRFAEGRSNPQERVGRNDNCPCGSGLKYKKCCLART